MNAELAIDSEEDSERARAGALVEVLLPELVCSLTAGSHAGTVLGGRPHLRLFGEAIDLALPLRALRRASEAGWGESLVVDEDTLARHGQAIAAAEGYLLSAAGMYAARGRGTACDEGVPADAMSLRLHTSCFARPIDALMRADPAQPETWLAVVAALERAARRERARERLALDHPYALRLARLEASVAGLASVEDPRLPRVLGELLVHALMAVRALGRQPTHACATGPLYASTLPKAALGELRRVSGEHEGVWCDPGLLCATPPRTAGHWHDRNERAAGLEIRPLLRGSAGRRLDGSVDQVECREPGVWFPPGTPFELQAGPSSSMLRLIELPVPVAVAVLLPLAR